MPFDPGEHPVTFDASEASKAAPVEGPAWYAEMSALRLKVKPSGNLTAILSMLVSGFLPNGVDWRHNGDEPQRLPFCKARRGSGEQSLYILCCGHALTPKRAQQLVSAGLLDEGPFDQHQRPTLVITPAGREWLRLNWRDQF
jgi:hypothetical protein